MGQGRGAGAEAEAEAEAARSGAAVKALIVLRSALLPGLLLLGKYLLLRRRLGPLFTVAVKTCLQQEPVQTALPSRLRAPLLAQ